MRDDQRAENSLFVLRDIEKRFDLNYIFQIADFSVNLNLSERNSCLSVMKTHMKYCFIYSCIPELTCKTLREYHYIN